MRRHEMRHRVGDSDMGTWGVLGGSTYFPEEAEGWTSQAELVAWKTKAPWRAPGRILSPSSTPGHSAPGAGLWPCHARQHTQMQGDHLSKGNTTRISVGWQAMGSNLIFFVFNLWEEAKILDVLLIHWPTMRRPSRFLSLCQKGGVSNLGLRLRSEAGPKVRGGVQRGGGQEALDTCSSS